ncbi:alpha/beta hydrolase [Microbispora sp. NPDC049125]|uniref:alpha/beta hydrolase n=1 Tax=Microbispora sp. NPDC049125 TaxID=3154929 RepID=UPI003466024D
MDITPEYAVSWQAAALNGVLRGTMKPISAVLLRNTAGMAVASRLICLGERVPGILPKNVSIIAGRLGSCPGEWVRAGAETHDVAGPDARLEAAPDTRRDAAVDARRDAVPDAHRDAVPDVRPDARPDGCLDEGKVLLYFHGGAYFICSPATHRPITWRLSAALRRPVFSLDYRQGPIHSLPESLSDALEAYEGLLGLGYAPKDIVIAGDSAGGHLTLATLLALRDRSMPLPAAAVCLSPWTDLSTTRRQVRFWTDPMLPAGRVDWLARRWTDGLDCRDPLVSPVYGDFTGLPPLMIVTGSTELLRDEARKVAVNARHDGVPVTYEEWRRMPHAFALLADVLPEARMLFRHVSRFVGTVEGAGAASGAEAA